MKPKNEKKKKYCIFIKIYFDIHIFGLFTWNIILFYLFYVFYTLLYILCTTCLYCLIASRSVRDATNMKFNDFNLIFVNPLMLLYYEINQKICLKNKKTTRNKRKRQSVHFASTLSSCKNFDPIKCSLKVLPNKQKKKIVRKSSKSP